MSNCSKPNNYRLVRTSSKSERLHLTGERITTGAQQIGVALKETGVALKDSSKFKFMN